MDLSGQTVLVTGADGGIGRALVQTLAMRDMHLLAGMRDTGNFTPLGERGARDPAGTSRALLARADRRLRLPARSERIDVLINNAGRRDRDARRGARRLRAPHG
jgi:NAD(P)-dependent dehydrogenase (short-subunit alcohol dehydrogenase family)